MISRTNRRRGGALVSLLATASIVVGLSAPATGQAAPRSADAAVGAALLKSSHPEKTSPLEPGYWVVTRAGNVIAAGSAERLRAITAGSGTVVGLAYTPDAGGYWLVTSAGRVFCRGDARKLGPTHGLPTNRIVGIAATPDGGGLWLAAANGRIYAFGDARKLGPTHGLPTNRIVGIAATPDGGGLWLAAANGRIYAFGDARKLGPTHGLPTNRIVGIAATPDGGGLWLAAANGRIYAFGDAPTLAQRLVALPDSAVAIAAPPDPNQLQTMTVNTGSDMIMYLRTGGELIVPSGALPTGERIVVRTGPTPVGQWGIAGPLGQALRLSVLPKWKFARPLTLEFPVPSGLPSELAGYGLYAVATLNASSGRWTEVPTSYDPTTHMLITAIEHFSIWSGIKTAYEDAKTLASCLADNLGDGLAFLGCLVTNDFGGVISTPVTHILNDLLPKTCWADLVKADVIAGITGKAAVVAYSVFKAAWLSDDACTGEANSGGLPVPVVSSITPTSGPSGGGNIVTITGDWFQNVTSVTFGGKSADFQVEVNSNNTMTATVPPGDPGTVSVRADDGTGGSDVTAADSYTYYAQTNPNPPSPSPPVGGGVSIGWSSLHPNWITMTLSGFAPGGYTYSCDFGSGGDASFSLTITSNPETIDNGKTCYDAEAGDTVWVTIGSVDSNIIATDGSTSPPTTGTESISIGWGNTPAPAGDWMDITFTNFPTGTVSWHCVEEGTSYGPYSTTLTSSTETLTTNTCYDTESGGSDYVTADGVDSNIIATDGSTSPPTTGTESISIGWGNTPAPAGDWMDITFTNFPTGTVSWHCVEEGTSYGPYSTTLTSSTETLTTNTCYDTESGGSDYVTADGVDSNIIATDGSTSPPTTGTESISIGWGNTPAPAGDWMDITFTNFPTGTVSWHCVEEGTSYGPYSTTLTSSTETLTTNTCYDTESGGSDYVTADGVDSNIIATDGSTSPPTTGTESISIGWGNTPAPAGDWMDITFTNFPTGTVSWHCVEEGTSYGPYSTTLTSSTETLTTNTCYDTESGGSDYVTADGVDSNIIATDGSTSPPTTGTESISIGWGNTPAPAGDWMDITFTNFPTGTVSWHCVEEGTSYGPYSTTLSSSTETLTTHTCYDTEPGGSDYVSADGVNSNTIGTD